jgi:tRNA-2-methylthio-N6-dimethylallyladenosine synthase
VQDTKKVLIKTFGCQMNVYDSERMGEALAAQGYSETATLEDADLVVLNTCHIREKAVEKVYSDLGRIRQIKDDRAKVGRDTSIVVAGCVAQAEGSEIARRVPVVDLVIGPQSYHRLPELLIKAKRDGQSIVETAFPDDDKFAALPQSRQPRAATAFLTVQEGCDKFCTFCVVPYTRGMEYSRPVSDLKIEAQKLVAAGVREITLLGQNVNAYHGDGANGRPATLAALIRTLAEIEGLERLRYMTSHPRDMGDDLIAAHRDVPQLMPFLHLPVQSGSDRILAGMNRKHSVQEYRDIIAKVRDARPDIAISTDFIVGFPSETEREFEDTLDLIRDVRFAQAYSFKYSPRPGTPAASLEDQVSEAVKSERLARLQQVLSVQQSDYNQTFVGQTIPVLFDKSGRIPGQLVGRSPYLHLVQSEALDSFLGRTMPVKITSAGPNSLAGIIAN